ncbi:hypothetical protein LXL04_018013 [Taraxacum kok-saghyz]
MGNEIMKRRERKRRKEIVSGSYGKKYVDAVCSTVIWVLWTYRNAVVFKQMSFKKNCILDKICDLRRGFLEPSSSAAVSPSQSHPQTPKLQRLYDGYLHLRACDASAVGPGMEYGGGFSYGACRWI